MSDYMDSLEKLSTRREQVYYPGHGDAIPDGPRFVAMYIEHRRARERSILARLEKARATSRRWCARSISASTRGW
jgi:glyoxylase-like metal-dependent hydrolase (beta-lactamase superfamily II)